MTLFCFNGAADRKHLGVPQKILRAVDQVASIFCAGLDNTRRVYSGFWADPSFYTYLESCGLSPARLTQQPQNYERGEPWTVDREVLEFFADNSISVQCPAPEIVRRVNSRFFAHRHLSSLGVPGAAPVTQMDDFYRLRRCVSDFVLKPDHGNAGGHFLKSGTMSESALKQALAAALQRGERFVFEPWCDVVCDIATKIHISPAGTVDIAGHHRNMCNRSGAFYANIFCENDSRILPWRNTLDVAARRVGKALFAAGYFGPAGIDSFVYKKNNEVFPACAIDINARHTISTVSYGIRRKRDPVSAGMYRFIGKRRHVLPASYEKLTSQLNAFFFADEMPLLTTPLRMMSAETGPVQPARSAFYLEAGSEEELLEKDERLRRCILK
jgi:hypothetical protein